MVGYKPGAGLGGVVVPGYEIELLTSLIADRGDNVTLTRGDSSALVKDHNGYLRYADVTGTATDNNDTPRFEGVRVVKNERLLVDSDEPLAVRWGVASAAKTDVAGAGENGETVVKISMDTSGEFAAETNGVTTTVGMSCTNLYRIRSVSGTAKVRLSNGLLSPSSGNIEIPDQWVWLANSFSSTSTALYAGIWAGTDCSAGNPYEFYVQKVATFIHPGTALQKTPDFISGQTVAYYPYENGNTHADAGGIVTFAQGAPITTGKGLLIERAATNYIYPSIPNDGHANWLLAGAATCVESSLVANPVGTLASKITFNNASDSMTVLTNTTEATSTRFEPSFAFKRDTLSGNLLLKANIFGTGQWTINLDYAGGDVDWSEFQIIDRYHPAVTVNTEFACDAAGDIAYQWIHSTTNTGIFYLGVCQSEVGTYPTSLIPTLTAALTRPAEVASIPVAGNLPVNDFTIEVEVTFNVSTTTYYVYTSGILFEFIINSTTYTIVTNSGQFNQYTLPLPVAGDTHKYVIRKSSVEGGDLFTAAGKATPVVELIGNGSVAPSTLLHLGSDEGSAGFTSLNIKNLKIHHRALSDAECLALVS